MGLKIALRVDGDHNIGMGHVHRSINLARELKNQKNKIIFLTKNFRIKKMLPKSYDFILLPKNNLKKEKEIIKKLNIDIAVIDKLEERTSIVSIFLQNCNKVFAIDYIGKNKNLIKHGINSLYQKSGILNIDSFSGFSFAIINPKFTKNKTISVKKKVKSILVLQGGADTLCFTPKIINALNLLKDDFKITVVLGSSFKCWKKLRRSQKYSTKSLRILHNVKNMPSIMAKHDIAITGGGITLLELCCVGIPSLIVCGAQFENETANLLQKKGFGINLGFGNQLPEKKIAWYTKRLLSNYNKRKKMNKIGRALIDGKGSKRVAKIITT